MLPVILPSHLQASSTCYVRESTVSSCQPPQLLHSQSVKKCDGQDNHTRVYSLMIHTFSLPLAAQSDVWCNKNPSASYREQAIVSETTISERTAPMSCYNCSAIRNINVHHCQSKLLEQLFLVFLIKQEVFPVLRNPDLLFCTSSDTFAPLRSRCLFQTVVDAYILDSINSVARAMKQTYNIGHKHSWFIEFKRSVFGQVRT